MSEREVKLVAVPDPSKSEDSLPDMPDDLVGIQVAQALLYAEQDPRIAWQVLLELQAFRLLSPWEPNPGRQDCWVRRDYKGLVHASVWWERDDKGELVEGWAARARIHIKSIGDLVYEVEPVGWAEGETGWKVRGLRGAEGGPYRTRDEALFAVREYVDTEVKYPTVAVALIYTDTALREQSWNLVPPFGQTVG